MSSNEGQGGMVELKTNRAESLSDGIFAIAMTLLAVGFDITAVPPVSAGETQLLQYLFGMWPDFLHYILSFLILGVFWIEHHRQFHYIRCTDTRLLMINVAGLMLVSLIPLTTTLVGDYGHFRIASILFELNLFVAGMVFYLHWAYAASRCRLLHETIDKSIVVFYKKRNMVIPIVSLAAICLSFVDARLGTMAYFAVPLALLALRK